VNKDKKPLSETHPELAKEADGWDPKKVVAGTNKRLPWKCNKGHKWIAQGNDRSSGKNCPFCSNNRVLAGYNDLATTHPELAKEAHGWDPTTVTFGTKKKLNWKCSKGHVWTAVGYNRSNGTSCSVCANFKVLAGYNDLATTHPELAKEAHGWDPTTVIAGTNKKLDWKCSKGHVWTAALNSRVNGNGCSVCSNYKVLVGTNDLATLNPALAKEAHGWDPTKVVAGTSKKLDWKCSKGHVWKATVVGRYRLKRNCPYCANYFVLAGYNDLATTHPELAMQAHGWDPTKVVAGNEKKMEWKCQKGHLWNASISGRTSGRNCSICSNKKVLAGFNDLATTHPELAKESHGWDPKTVFAGTGKKLDWKCQKGHVWSAISNNRVKGNGCIYCSNQKVLAGFNDLATTHPEVAQEANGWDPTSVVAGNEKKFEWKCKLGHTYKTSVKIKTTGFENGNGNGCPFCSSKKVLTGFNDVATTHPDLAQEADGWDPTKVVAGSSFKYKWRCKKGHRWASVIATRAKGVGCPSCAKFGYDPNLNGFLYFLIQPQWELFQIGITNFPDSRLISHKRNGFDLLELRGPLDGHTAKEIESSLLRYLKSQKADLSPEHIAGKFDGYSESWTIDSFQVNNLKELIDKANEAGF
jgi:hypothetical protein